MLEPAQQTGFAPLLLEVLEKMCLVFSVWPNSCLMTLSIQTSTSSDAAGAAAHAMLTARQRADFSLKLSQNSDRPQNMCLSMQPTGRVLQCQNLHKKQRLFQT